MKNKEIPNGLVIAVLVATFLGIFLSGLVIKGAKPTSATNVSVLPAHFPDVQNDSRYNAFLNSNALDPTQVVSVGNSQNNSPFNP